MSVNWQELLTVDFNEVTNLFTSHSDRSEAKLHVRAYTIRFTGTQQRFNRLMEFLDKRLMEYTFPEQERGEHTWRMGRDKFGDIAPIRDGKLGEMLLYVFVEAFLKTPLMAYKLKDLSNPNDQVKGADGVFVGYYKGQKALLIGESKVHRKLSVAIRSSLRSLQRFHEESAPYENELLIAKKYPRERNLPKEVFEAAQDILSDGYEVLVHPVFLSYDCGHIAPICRAAKDPTTAEMSLQNKIAEEFAAWEGKITAMESVFPRPFQVYLDYFFLPVEDSLHLRNQFYEMLHGHPYVPLVKRASLGSK
jgi:hypothetical protein